MAAPSPRMPACFRAQAKAQTEALEKALGPEQPRQAAMLALPKESKQALERATMARQARTLGEAKNYARSFIGKPLKNEPSGDCAHDI